MQTEGRLCVVVDRRFLQSSVLVKGPCHELAITAWLRDDIDLVTIASEMPPARESVERYILKHDLAPDAGADIRRRLWEYEEDERSPLTVLEITLTPLADRRELAIIPAIAYAIDADMMVSHSHVLRLQRHYLGMPIMSPTDALASLYRFVAAQKPVAVRPRNHGWARAPKHDYLV